MSTRLLALVFVMLALITVWIGFERFGPSDLDTAHLVRLLMALLVVSGAGYGFWRFRYDRGAAIAGVLFWGLAIAALAFGYSWLNR